MEERKTIFNYLGQIFMFFGIMMVWMIGFCLLFGEQAQEISSLFALGNKGLSVTVMLEFFLVAVVMVGLRILFFTDLIIRSLSVIARTVWMVLLVLMTISLCIVMFDWFPVEDWRPWLMFWVCFVFCFVGSLLITALKARAENQKMEEALKRLKQEESR